MRQRYVVQVVPELEESAPVVVPVPQPYVEPQVVPPPRRENVSQLRSILSDEELKQKELHIQRLFAEESIKTVQESVSITRPKKQLSETESSFPREDVFRTTLLKKSDPEERIERLYLQRQDNNSFRLQASLKKKTSFRFSWPKPSFRGRMIYVWMSLLIFVIFSAAGTFWMVQDIKAIEPEVTALIQDLQSSNVSSAKDRLELLEKKKVRYQSLFQKTRPVLRLVLGGPKVSYFDQLFDVADSGLSVVHSGFESYSILESGYRQFLGQESGESIETFSRVSGQLETLSTHLSALQASSQKLTNPYQVGAVTEMKDRLQESAPKMRKYFLAAQQLSFLIPDLLGKSGKKQYLVLLQNNAELRPTGGFIGSFGILTVENGRFLDFRVEDVYEADGQLNGYVAPPAEITKHLGESQWFLRDVNWSPDFPTVAQQASWFLDKEIKVKPDGVIGVNLSVVQKLLEVVGPVTLPDYDEVITKDNLYERAQMHAEMNFFPGSTQKRDFLSAVANALFTKLIHEDTNKLLILKALIQSADESELLVSIPTVTAGQALETLGWSGSVRTPECPPPFVSQHCFVDTVMQVEANVGVNKANQFITRSIEHTVQIQGEKADHLRKVVLTNSADSNAWPEGAYKVYFRLFVSDDAELKGITVNGQPIAASGLVVSEEHGKTVIGFPSNVPIQSSTEILVSYSVLLPTDTPLVYALFEQKQPGAGHDKMTHEFSVSDRKVLTIAPEPQISGSRIEFSSDRRTHQMFALELQ